MWGRDPQIELAPAAPALRRQAGLYGRGRRTNSTTGSSLPGRNAMTTRTLALASLVLFYLVTNFAWWAGYDLYPHTLGGLLMSYTAALPFFGWTLLGDLCYATVLFGGLALAERRVPALRPADG